MVLQCPMAVVRISLFGIQAEFQAPFVVGSLSWVRFEPFANDLLDLFGIEFSLKWRQWLPRMVFF